MLTSAPKNPLLHKSPYNLCICYMYERLNDYYNPYALKSKQTRLIKNLNG